MSEVNKNLEQKPHLTRATVRETGAVLLPPLENHRKPKKSVQQNTPDTTSLETNKKRVSFSPEIVQTPQKGGVTSFITKSKEVGKAIFGKFIKGTNQSSTPTNQPEQAESLLDSSESLPSELYNSVIKVKSGKKSTELSGGVK